VVHLVWEVVEKVEVVRMEGEVAVVERVVADGAKVVGHPEVAGFPGARENCFGIVVRDLLSAP
jgi:hypothetical protein